MLIALPSNHLHIVDAFTDAGFDATHIDAHARRFVEQLDPMIAPQAVMANMGGGGRFSMLLDELRSRMFARSRRNDAVIEVNALDEYRVTTTGVVRDGAHVRQHVVESDLFADLADRHGELRRMTDTLRTMLPRPDFTALERDAVVYGVDLDEQKALLPADGVRYVVIAGRAPLWVSDVDDVTMIPAEASPAEQVAAAVAAVRETAAA
jgi:hypothetical protein